METICEVHSLGSMAYQTAWDLQNRLAEERSRAAACDRLLLVEHPHTYTFGSSGHAENLLLSPEELTRRGIALFHADRGGDITYHGPGQLVGYPIIKLPRGENGLRADVVGYVRKLETVIIRTLADFDITGEPIAGLTGVWVPTPSGAAKVAAIGVKVNTRIVTKHGFALNVNTDLSYFDGIIPCGIDDKGVTSMAALLGQSLAMSVVTERLIVHFGAVFGFEIITLTGQRL